MRLARETVEPAFEPITITLDSLEEARALKVLCTTTAEDAVVEKANLAVSEDAIRDLSGNIFRALRAEGVSYLVPKDQRQ